MVVVEVEVADNAEPTSFSSVFDRLLASAQRSAVHLEMRDAYSLDDRDFADWRSGVPIVARERWPGWFAKVGGAVARGIEVRRARIVSEPISEYVRFEHAFTESMNIAAGELVRWLPRRQASDIPLPGNDFWLFDNNVVIFNHFAGDGSWVNEEECADVNAVKLCGSAFEAVWLRAIDHHNYLPA